MRSFATSTGGIRTEAKLQALTWLASQLRWEHTLDGLRDGDDAVERVAA